MQLLVPIALTPDEPVTSLFLDDGPVAIAFTDYFYVYNDYGQTYQLTRRYANAYAGTVKNETARAEAASIVVGLAIDLKAGDTVEVNYSGVAYSSWNVWRYTTASSGTLLTFLYGNSDTLYPSTPANHSQRSVTPTFTIRDNYRNVLAVAPGTSGSVTITAPHDISFIGLSVDFPVVNNISSYYNLFHNFDVQNFNFSYTIIDSSASAIFQIRDAVIQVPTLLNQILAAIQSLAGGFVASPEQQQKSEELLENVEDISGQIDDQNQIIEDNTYRPPAEEIIPSAPAELLPPADPAVIAGYDVIKEILAHDLFLKIMMMVFSLAFLRYVLFGKTR